MFDARNSYARARINLQIMAPSNKSSKNVCILCKTTDEENVVYFRFPKDPLERTIWANFCCIDPSSVTSTDRLCHRHFADEDIIHTNNSSRNALLVKKNAVPKFEVDSEGKRFENENRLWEELYATKKHRNMRVNEVLVSESDDERNANHTSKNVESSSSDEDIDISSLSREYSTVEEAQNLFADSKTVLEKIKRKHRAEQQRHRRLLSAFKQIKTKFKAFEQDHPAIIVPPTLLELSDDDSSPERR